MTKPEGDRSGDDRIIHISRTDADVGKMSSLVDTADVVLRIGQARRGLKANLEHDILVNEYIRTENS